jgi:PKD repeat protein
LGTGGIGPMGGPAYQYDARSDSRVKWPAHYDGKPLFYEWTRDYVKAFTLDANDQVTAIESVVPSIPIDNPMDVEFGPDGALYVLEYGDGYFSENPEAQLARIDYAPANKTPVVKVNAEPTVGDAPFTVTFTSAGTYDPDGDTLKYAWDFDADGDVDSRHPYPSFTYTENGDYRATLKVTDSTGRSASAEYLVHVGPVVPTVSFVTPTDGQPFEFGDTVPFEVAVTDDEPVNCSAVTVRFILGHNEHGHEISTASGCTGSFTTFLDPGHSGEGNIAAVFVAEYTDADGQTSSTMVVLAPQD